ncbi:MAG TPA: SH3 domain-containing protein [Aggregatilineaceae bacterium]|nr:SH3 domain-containing protein [Aggregatilineaceae bacterium]
MRRLLLAVLILATGASAAQAGTNPQQDEICTPEYINAEIAGLYDAWLTTSSENLTSNTSLNHLQELNDDIQAVIDLCANVAAASDPRRTESLGNGTLQDPYAYGYAGDTGAGFSLRVTNTIRPADQIVLRENRYNDRPKAGEEEYVIIGLELLCNESNTRRCEANYFDFELTGDSGTIYEYISVVYKNKFDVSAFGGGSGSGDLVFLIRQGDANLRLLYKESMFQDEFVVYEAEPSLDGGIRIQASANLNIRSEPNTTSAIMGTLPPAQPVIAIGRNSDGTWLKIPQGWVFAELVTTMSGEVETLPVMSPN